MRVLHIITGLGVGGAEQQLRLLLRYQGWPARVVTLTNAGAVADGIRRDGGQVDDLGMRGNRDVAALPRLVRLIRAGRYDLVHTHLYRACVYGRLAARLAGVPRIVATEHSLGPELIEGRPLTTGVRRLYLASERLGAVTVAVSGAVAKRLVGWGVPAGRVVVVPNGVEAGRYRFDPGRRAALRRELGIAPDAFVIGTVGRLIAGKRLDVLLRALPRLDRAILLVVGDGPARAELAAVAARAGVAGRVVFAGERDDVPGLLSAMDTLASASPAETFGLAILEGLAAGLPVRYVSCPALDELPASAAPGATRLPADPAAFAASIGASIGASITAELTPYRLATPPAAAHYDIARLAGQVAAVYRAVPARHRPVTGSGQRVAHV